MVDRHNQVAAEKPDILGEAGRLNFRHQHTALPFHAQAAAALLGQVLDPQAELHGPGFPRSRVFTAARAVGESFGAVFDGQRGIVLAAVAHVGKLHAIPDRRRHDGVNQVVAGVHRLAVHRCDDVARLEPGLVGRTIFCDGFDDDAVGRAHLFQGNGI